MTNTKQSKLTIGLKLAMVSSLGIVIVLLLVGVSVFSNSAVGAINDEETRLTNIINASNIAYRNMRSASLNKRLTTTIWPTSSRTDSIRLYYLG